MIGSSTFSIDNLYENVKEPSFVYGPRSSCNGKGGEKARKFITHNTTPKKFDRFVSATSGYAIENGDAQGYNALCIAAHKTNYQLISHLIKQKACINLCSDSGLSPVHCAILGPMARSSLTKVRMVLKKLVRSGAKINLASQNKTILKWQGIELPALATPLWIIADLGLLSLIRPFIELGGKVYIPLSKRGHDNILTVIELYNKPLNQFFVYSLIKELGKTRKNTPKICHTAKKNFSKGNLKLLISNITLTTTPSEFKKLCLDNHISPTSDSAIHAATYRGNIMLMYYTIKLGASPYALDSRGRSLIIKSIKSFIQPNLKIELLFTLGIDVNFSGRNRSDTPLCFAAEQGRLDCVETLLLNGETIPPRRLSTQGKLFVNIAIKKLLEKHREFFYSKYRFLALTPLLSTLPQELRYFIAYKFMAHFLVKLERPTQKPSAVKVESEENSDEELATDKNFQGGCCFLQ